MQQLVFFLLGQKGHEVLKAAIAEDHKNRLRLVVVGEDNNVHNDYSSEILALCNEYGIEHCARSNFSELLGSAENLIAIAAGWRWLIKFPFIQVIVFHDSLLPKYRGFNPLVTALLNRDPETGVTAIIANGEFDCGDVIASRAIKLSYPVKIKDVIDQVSGLYFDLAKYILEELKIKGCLIGAPQDATMASYSVWRDEDDYRINWNSSAESISHFVKCLSFPYKGASTVFYGRLIRILEAKIEPDVEIANRDVGKVLFIVDNKPVVICGTGLLRIDAAVDDDGRSVLPFKNFRTRLK